MIKNLNPLYEGHFLSDKDKKAGIKMLWNGIKKNGAVETIKRNSKAALKRGEHRLKQWPSATALGDNTHSSKVREVVKGIGKRVTQDKPLSAKQLKAIKQQTVY